MVIGEKFVWLHLGKTGGDFTHYIFHKYLRQHLLHIDNIDGLDKHIDLYSASIKYYQYNLLNKDLILNIRKLPDWIVSNNRYKSKITNITDRKIFQKIIHYSNMGLVYVDETQNITDSCSWMKPDDVLEIYIRDKYPKFFIRTEYLISDFNRIISQYIPDTSISNTEKPINVNVDIANFHIESDNIAAIYQNNPLWTSIERKLYADEMRSM